MHIIVYVFVFIFPGYVMVVLFMWSKLIKLPTFGSLDEKGKAAKAKKDQRERELELNLEMMKILVKIHILLI
jgi:hypothetical protein